MKRLSTLCVNVMWVTVSIFCIAAIFRGMLAAPDMTVGASLGAEPVLSDGMRSVIDFIFAYGPWTAGISLVLAIVFSLLARKGVASAALTGIRVLAFTLLVIASAALITALIFHGDPNQSQSMKAILDFALYYGPGAVFVSLIATVGLRSCAIRQEASAYKPI